MFTTTENSERVTGNHLSDVFEYKIKLFLENWRKTQNSEEHVERTVHFAKVFPSIFDMRRTMRERVLKKKGVYGRP